MNTSSQVPLWIEDYVIFTKLLLSNLPPDGAGEKVRKWESGLYHLTVSLSHCLTVGLYCSWGLPKKEEIIQFSLLCK